MRCLTLANELKSQGHKCLFICREQPGHLGSLISHQGHRLILLPMAAEDLARYKILEPYDYSEWLGVTWEEDACQTLNVLYELKPDWLVVDHYALDAKWETCVQNAVDKIMVIDDLANRSHECVLLLDQNLGRVESDYKGLVSSECDLLIGSCYALLRPEFSALRERSLKRRENIELKRILISLGGVDRTNVTGQILSVLEHSVLPVSTELDIIMGASAPYLEEVYQQAGQLPFKAMVSVNVQDMAERMHLADLSIGAAGGTAWERGCLGLPSLLVIQAENQVLGANALVAMGAAIVISDLKQFENSLAEILVELSNSPELINMSKASASITDGSGVIEVVRALTTSIGV